MMRFSKACTARLRELLGTDERAARTIEELASDCELMRKTWKKDPPQVHRERRHWEKPSEALARIEATATALDALLFINESPMPEPDALRLLYDRIAQDILHGAPELKMEDAEGVAAVIVGRTYTPDAPIPAQLAELARQLAHEHPELAGRIEKDLQLFHRIRIELATLREWIQERGDPRRGRPPDKHSDQIMRAAAARLSRNGYDLEELLTPVLLELRKDLGLPEADWDNVRRRVTKLLSDSPGVDI